MLESESGLWRERLSAGLPTRKSEDDELNGAVLVSEMSYLREAGVPPVRLSALSDSLSTAGKSVKAVKSALRREADLGPKALRGVATAWQQAISTSSDAQLAREHFRKLAMATSLAESMRDRVRSGRR